MTVGQWLVAVPFGLLVVYLLVRLSTAAYFKSKADYQQRGQNHVER
jgi:hypothetical protein